MIPTPAAAQFHRHSAWLRPSLLALGLALPAQTLSAQTDFYNTDARRPIQIEDAYAMERRGIELQASSLRLERSKGGLYRWGFEPELAYGVLPRTQLEIGIPIVLTDGPGRPSTGIAGVDLSVLYNLNHETSIPALAVRADVLLPVGSLAADRAYPSLTGIATKSIRKVRLHLNGQYTFGSEPATTVPGTVSTFTARGSTTEISRWLAGASIDRTFALRSTLITGEVFARKPFADSDIEWNAGVGARYQLSPRWVLDGGGGRRLTGDDRAWYLTVGSAFAIGRGWRR